MHKFVRRENYTINSKLDLVIQYFEIDTKTTQEFISSPPAPRQKNYHEIMWVQDGEADFVIDGDVFNVSSPSFFIIQKDRYHQFLPNKAIVGQVIRFSEDFLDEFPRLLFSKFSHISEVKINGKDELYFEKLFDLFKTEYNESEHSLKVINNLLKTIIYKLDNIRRQQFSKPEDLLSIDLFDQFQVLLDEFVTKERAVKFYADKLNVTSRKLGNTIKSLFHTTTENIILQRLLIEAKRQLAYSDKNIAQIAYDLNFKDNSYFTKFFRKQSFITPKQYRSNLGNVK